MKLSVVLVPMAALALAGCSSTPPGATPSAPSASASVDCETASQDEWAQHCLPSSSPQETPPGPLPAGQPFAYTHVMSEGPSADFQVTLTATKCGIKRLAKAARNPDWNGSDSVPEMIDQKAPEGSEFCRADWSWKNVGKTPGYTLNAGDIVLGEERFAKSADDDTYATELTRQVNESQTLKINPRQETRTVDVWTVPAGSEATAVWFPMETLLGGSLNLVAAR